MAIRRVAPLKIPYLFWLIPVSRFAALPMTLVFAMIRLVLALILLTSAASATSYHPLDELSTRMAADRSHETGRAVGGAGRLQPMIQSAADAIGVD